MSLLETPQLDELWPEWLALHSKLGREGSRHLAAPFASAADATLPSHRYRFMFVGQATKGTFWHENFDPNAKPEESLLERKIQNRKYVAERRNPSRFWQAFRFGSRLDGTDDFSNAVWSNIAKIGLSDRNVDRETVRLQSDLATRTLAAELAAYHPTLVHFVTGQVGDECILQATGTAADDWRQLSNDKTSPEADIWFLQTAEKNMVWTRHPNWAKPGLVKAWNNKLLALSR